MKTPAKLIVLILPLLLISILTACTSSPQENPTADITVAVPAELPASTLTATPALPPASTLTPVPAAPEHRIGIRVVDGIGEFFDKDTDEKFVPRGSNYVRLDPQPRPDGSEQVYHSLFDPEYFDPEEIELAFSEMQALGYNTVRVFTSQNTIVTDYALDDAYMQNVIQFLEMAEDFGQVVIFTLDWMPGGKYGEVLNADCCENFNMFNANTLPTAGLEANKLFFQDFLNYLIDHQAPMKAIFSLQLRNELFYERNFPPLSLESGIVVGANRESYDMSIPGDKTRMADEVMVYWINSLTAAIHEIDPALLVSVGFFVPQEPHTVRAGDPRYINTAPAIWESEADFIDLHPYPGFELTLAQYVANFGIAGMAEKPIIIGEFGVHTSSAGLAGAASMLKNWQIESCQYGFDGWLVWSWDIYENNEFFSAKSGSGEIAEILAPVNRPDPCE